MTRAPTPADVREAAARLAGTTTRTPVLHAPALDPHTAGHVLLKCENLQRTGSFKFRGACNAVARLDDDDHARGVIAFSSGNHALAVAPAAAAAGTTALLVMPSDAPPAKHAAVRRLGAEVVTFDRYTDDRFAITASLAAERGLTVIPPYDHPDVIAGAGTTTTEFLDQAGDLDVLVFPLGGGGQLAGATLGLADHKTRLVGVETAVGDKNRRSLDAGERVRIPVPHTIADGVTGEVPGELTFPLIQRRVDDVLVVDDDEIRAAMRLLFEEVKLVVEPSGALAVAALLAGPIHAPGARVGVVLSGGNITLDRLHHLLN
ncbi:pyridoxal-phosphate dependent enzyme [Actinosynnema sp. CS-041913]|uniref:pyridoxal-phosphate dependent enzyme n=1 Tax=Actinosynnema sp. CS-041913 TaxID=3239917 RepID=UPI003D8A8FDD